MEEAKAKEGNAADEGDVDMEETGGEEDSGSNASD